MQRLAEICIERPVFAAMVILAMVVAGAAGYAGLGVDWLPSVDLPTVSARDLPDDTLPPVVSKVNYGASPVMSIAMAADRSVREMKALDFTLNSVTMLALALTVGIVIDDAIVVLARRLVVSLSFHVVHLGTVPLPVRHHGGRGRPRLAPRLRHAHPDEVGAAARGRDASTRDRSARTDGDRHRR